MELYSIYHFRKKHAVSPEDFRAEWKTALDEGYDANEEWPDEYSGLRASPLFHATLERDVSLAEVLLQYGADVERRNKAGRNALHEAIVLSEQKLVQFFLEHGADPNATVTSSYLEGGTALHVAVAEGQVYTIRNLLSRGAKPLAKTYLGWTPLDLAILDRQHTVVSILLEHVNWADVVCSAQSELQKSLCATIYNTNRQNIARHLIEHGLRSVSEQHRDVYLQCLSRITPLPEPDGGEQLRDGFAMVSQIENMLLEFASLSGQLNWSRGLCTQCQRFEMQDGYHAFQVFKHSPDLGSVKRSADHGCSLCQFFIASLDARYCLLHQISKTWREEFAVQPALRVRVGAKNGTDRLGDHELIIVCEEKIAFVDLDNVQKQNSSAIAETGPSDTTTTGSDRSLRTAKAWLQRCLEEHPSCKMDTIGALPTRVIHVGDETTGPHIYHPKGECQPYAALSYCWGEGATFWSSSTNIDLYSKSLPLEHMPQTMLDAITVTRKLGIKFLWIDALCILQDSRKDKVQELAYMGDIFAKAHLTIAAKVSESSYDGLFRDRDWSVPAMFPLDLRLPSGMAQKLPRVHGRIKNTRTSKMNRLMALFRHQRPREMKKTKALDTRGWALQEECLSRRMLNFKAHRLSWVCAGSRCSERIPEEDSSQSRGKCQSICRRLFATGEFIDHLSYPREEALFAYWTDVVKNYSRRTLSDPSDKLAAVAGIQASMGEHLKDVPIAGMWKGRFFSASLLWQVAATGIDNATSRFPSWSWASTTLPVNYIKPNGGKINAWSWYHETIYLPEIISWHLESMDQLDSIGGYILLRCQMMRLAKIKHKARKASHLELHFDAEECDCTTNPWIMLVNTSQFQSAARYKKYNHKYEIYTNMLLLEQIDEARMDFRRIGLATAKSWDIKWHQQAQSMDIRFF